MFHKVLVYFDRLNVFCAGTRVYRMLTPPGAISYFKFRPRCSDPHLHFWAAFLPALLLPKPLDLLLRLSNLWAHTCKRASTCKWAHTCKWASESRRLTQLGQCLRCILQTKLESAANSSSGSCTSSCTVLGLLGSNNRVVSPSELHTAQSNTLWLTIA